MSIAIKRVQRVVDGMASRGFERIVNFTFTSVKMPLQGHDLSRVARAGLTAFLAGVARSVADQGVTINQLLPGVFDTDRLRGGMRAAAERSGTSIDDVASTRAAGIPASRFGNTAESDATLALLCSSHAAYIAGQNLLVNSGAYPWGSVGSDHGKLLF